MATSLAVPVAYITVLVTALAIFSRVYRRRKLAEQTYEPWFPSHPSRDFYISLLSSPDPLDNMVKSALLLRAIEDVKRIWRIRDDKAALTSLHTRGLLGDDTKARFEFAEKELEAEILDVVQEANSFKQGWGTLIFATATEMAQAERTRETVLNIPKIRQREEKRLAVRRKYLPETTPAPSPAAALQSAPAPTPAQITSTPQKGSSASTSTSVSGSAPGSGSSTPAQAIEKEGTTLSPQAAGGLSTTSTPNKNTPSKKKKGKK